MNSYNKAILKTIRHFPTCFYRNSIKKLNFLNKVTYLFWNNFIKEKRENIRLFIFNHFHLESKWNSNAT